ncbi:hypothetical protein L6452_26972 [Arctium lappa]|uniref:Uncharacterized protein n=1 Tax=Arctium lappa TaxID=4217 RepID=A0ACB8ZWZ1_ARCLA|nr:hypothetical protein L6452_26972 [Arctium lappa]
MEFNTIKINSTFTSPFESIPKGDDENSSFRKYSFYGQNEVRIGKLLEDLDALAGTISVKSNKFVKCARSAKIYAYIMNQLKKEMPRWIGKAKAHR